MFSYIHLLKISITAKGLFEIVCTLNRRIVNIVMNMSRLVYVAVPEELARTSFGYGIDPYTGKQEIYWYTQPHQLHQPHQPHQPNWNFGTNACQVSLTHPAHKPQNLFEENVENTCVENTGDIDNSTDEKRDESHNEELGTNDISDTLTDNNVESNDESNVENVEKAELSSTHEKKNWASVVSTNSTPPSETKSLRLYGDRSPKKTSPVPEKEEKPYQNAKKAWKIDFRGSNEIENTNEERQTLWTAFKNYIISINGMKTQMWKLDIKYHAKVGAWYCFVALRSEEAATQLKDFIEKDNNFLHISEDGFNNDIVLKVHEFKNVRN